jgi:hydroxymethylglutaryl-CoA lyase
MSFPNYVKLVEVGPRDGLQNEASNVPTQVKIELINRLSETGVSVIEATSFVSPRWIPQLGDNAEVFSAIQKKPGISYPVLVPNLTGLEAALAVGVKDIAVFTTPSETFSERNTNCSVATSVARIKELMLVAKQQQLRVRAYLSCVLGCPYEGDIQPDKVASLASTLYDMGCDEISLGDTIGVGTALKTRRLLETVSQVVPLKHVAVHFHDTYGQALTNIYAALELGIAIIDSSVAGLGGCPYAKGATGNVATEDVLYLLNGMGIETGVDLQKLVAVGQYISQQLGRSPQSKANVAISSKGC